ncbi:MAG: Rrf2 family transcriptional regulator [Oscillospiraceae bacterium]
MHMTLEANYAVRIVELLSQHEGRIDAKSIAEQSQVPVRFALKILRKLVSDEIVCSFKGAKGGYQLGKSAAEITLREVIESVEGPFMISRCQGEEYPCKKTDCKLHNIYSEISTYVRDKLDSYTFESICDESMDCGKRKK